MGQDDTSDGADYYDDTEYQRGLEMKETNTLYFVLFSILLVAVLILSKLLHEYRPLHKVLSEASLALLLSMSVGFVLDLVFTMQTESAEEADQVVQKLLSFSPNVFFMALLPPIIFNSGYQLRRELFYRHISPITLCAAVGTTLATLVCAGLLWAASDWWGGDFSPTLLELLAFGSLISATDTVSVIAVLQQKRVDPHLFYLVFGESALNDAVALVLFNTFAGFLRNPEPTDHWKAGVGFLLDFGRQAVGSPALGIAFGALSALVFKTLNLRKAEFRMLELSLFLICMYLPFMIAECLSLSGIVTIFFAGLSVRRYTAPNVSTETQKVGETIFGLSSFLAETCIFIELGLSIFGFSGSFHWRFCLFALGACLVGRAMAIYPLSYAHNVSLREFPSESDLPTVAISPSDVSSVDGSAGANSGNGSPLRKNQKKKGRRRTPVKRKDKKISVPMAHVLWFAGLRGAVAYACVRDFPDTNGHADEFVAATMFIILFTVVIMGGGTEYLLEYLGIDMGVDEDAYMFQWRKERELKGTFHHLEEVYIHQVVTRLDAKIPLDPPFPFSDDDEISQASPRLEEEKEDPAFGYQVAEA